MSAKPAALTRLKKTLRHSWIAVAGAFTLGASPAPTTPPENLQATEQTATPEAYQGPVRTLTLYNLHTEERATVTYWRNGQYDEAALLQVSQLLRDHRRNETQRVNPQTLDILFGVKQKLSAQYPDNPFVFEIISGYRAEETTNDLRARGDAVARGTSQHQLGTAIDFRVEGVSLVELRDTAWCLQLGGVGYYPEEHNRFIHVDSARVRFWPASPRPWRCMGS